MRTMILALAVPFLVHGAGAATIDITYNFVPVEAQAAIEHAAGIWEGILVSPVPIKAMVTWVPMGDEALGITFPNGRRDLASLPLAQTWYPTSLANAITGTETNPGETDFDIFLDSGTNWYLGTDGETPVGQYDLVSVALHEMGHGLGFIGLSKKEAGIGSFGLLLASDFAPLVTSFPWPQLDTLPGIFDRFLSHPQNGPLDLMENPGTPLGSAMTSNQLRFNGAMAMAANDGAAPRIYSPSTFALGSSCVHLNESTYPTDDPNELMTPFSSTGHASHWPGPICLAVLQDIGWTLVPDVGLREMHVRDVPHVFPVPATDRITLSGFHCENGITIRDAQGRTIRTLPCSPTIDVSDLPAGYYVIGTNGTSLNACFLKN